jgi:hypothetical protein
MDKESTIRKYLELYSIPTSSIGYRALYLAISIASEHPEYSCNKIFEMVSQCLWKNGADWRRAYKNAHYAISKTKYDKGPYTFVKDCSIGLEAKESY